MKEFSPDLREIDEFFSREGISYAIIGGVAVQRWGEPRFTEDIDITVMVAAEEEPKLIAKLVTTFEPRISDAAEFALRHRVCLVRTSNGCSVDISFGVAGFEEELIKRTSDFEIGDDCRVPVCSAEDLVILKAVAGRPRDWEDIEGVLYRQHSGLDLVYLRSWLNEFSLLLEQPALSEQFEALWKEIVGQDTM